MWDRRKIAGLRRRVYAHHRRYRRDFPWRRTRDPYRILVSEVMLQQTQADRVVPKYRAFVRTFPNARALARASTRDVLASWSGLGYNRRALFLKRAAEVVTRRSGGRLPVEAEALKRLPGVGPYTAGAVRAFAFNQPDVLIETNVRSVFLHHLFPNHRRVSDRQLRPALIAALDQRNPRRWYEALMDYGSWLKRRVPNPSRRSSHHVRQRPYAGSNRQLRGAIVRALVRHPLTARQLAWYTGRALAETTRAVVQLRNDGLVTVTKNCYRLAH